MGSSAASPRPSSARALGLWMCTALVVGNVIGMGIFVMPATLAPQGLNALGGWLITVVGCAFIAITFATLARAFPQDDGPYTYIKRVFGEGPAFVTMWCYWVSTWVTNAALAVGVVGYLTVFIPALGNNHWFAPLTALSLLWLFVLINLAGARTAGWVQILTTVLKLVPLFGVIVLGIWVLVTHPAAYLQHVPPNTLRVSELSAATTATLFGMLGIECATIPACRVRDPARTIPRATVLGTIITALIYICVSIVPMLLIPQAELAASNAPFADLFARVLGANSGKLIAAFVIVSGLGALNGWTMMIGEITQAVARHGRLPVAFAQENAHGAPTLALVITAAVTSIMLLVNYNESIASGFSLFIIVVTAANLPLYFVCAFALMALAKRGEISGSRAQVSWLMIVGAATVIYCIWGSAGVGLRPLLYAVVLGAIGVPAYWSSRFIRRSAAAVAS